ncbi:hypoxanthine phosphoribosyltransferase [Rhodoligotrophos ferricapiens]|uniref:hypoxanthine phosphoribosyltransferase n=1 Tax=Rhodoligotrophos ferricapiens TaxID=3069264 RepID=UPI00315C6BBF
MSLPRIDVLFSEPVIARRVEKLAKEIAAMTMPRLLVIPVLKGSFIFAADLIRSMHRAGVEPEIDFLMLASYHEDTRSSGRIDVLRDIATDVSDRGVLLIDDILESGRTLHFAKELMARRGARQVKTAVLLDKPHRRAQDLEADFVGFKCPDCFVVGYGMDMAHRYRELPFIGVIKDPAD